MATKIMYDNNCYGCPDCVHCGRSDYSYEILICDKCGKRTEKVFELDGEQICTKCLSVDDTHSCSECDEDTDDALMIENRIYCKECAELLYDVFEEQNL